MSSAPLLSSPEGQQTDDASQSRWPGKSILSLFHRYVLFGNFATQMKLARDEGSVAVRPEKLPDLWPGDDLSYWAARFTARTEKIRKKGKAASFGLLRALFSVFKLHFSLILVFKVLATLLSLWSASLMADFLKWQEISPDKATSAERIKGMTAGAGILAVELIYMLGFTQIVFWTGRVGIRVQGVLSSGLLHRVVRVPDASVGVDGSPPLASSYNLLMVDVPAILNFVFGAMELTVLPIRVALSFRMLRNEVGPASLVGLYTLIGVVCIIMCYQVHLGFLKGPYLRKRDARISRCHETLSDIRTFRMIGWEDIAGAPIRQSREEEMYYLRKRAYVDAASNSFTNAAYYLTMMALFVSYVIWSLKSDTPFVMKASVAIPAMQVLGRLIGPLTNLPSIVNTLIEGYISIDRYERYIFSSPTPSEASTVASETTSASEAEDVDESSPFCLSTAIVEADTDEQPLIMARNAVFSWNQPERDSAETTLSADSGRIGTPPSSVVGAQGAKLSRDSAHISIPFLQVKRGECLAVVGDHGSGKSSLLLALIGEMRKQSGFVKVTRSSSPNANYQSIGYASQNAWIPSGTVRSAILFGRPFLEERYQTVVSACELQQDFSIWPEGDARVVSEGAGNLSGGQRTRVALARALYDYSGTSVFLLDSPFSSTDPLVGSSIFQNLCGPQGLLKDTALILTIDESSLRYFLRSMDQQGVQLGVQLKTRLIEGGMLSEQETLGLPDLEGERGEAARVVEELPWEDDGQASTSAPPSLEQSYSGAVEISTYRWFTKHTGLLVVFLMVLFISCFHVGEMGTDFWLAHWASLTPANATKPKETPGESFLQEDPQRESIEHQTIDNEIEASLMELRRRRFSSSQSVLDVGPELLSFLEREEAPRSWMSSLFNVEDSENLFGLKVLVLIGIFNIVAVTLLYYSAAWGSLKAATSIHRQLLKSVMNAPFWLYDFLPLGVLVNRFSADMATVDSGPIYGLTFFFGSCVNIVLVVIALVALSPWCFPFFPLIAWGVYAFVYTLYRPTCRELQRSRLLALSPLCGNLSEAESGGTVIRALGGQNFYIQQNILLTKNYMKVQFTQAGANQWASVRLQLLTFCFTIMNTMVPVYLGLMGFTAGASWLTSLFRVPAGSQLAGYIGISISLALGLPDTIASVVASIAGLEQRMCCVQRVRELVLGLGPVDAHVESTEISDLQELPERSGVKLIQVEVSYQQLEENNDLLHHRDETLQFRRKALPPSLTDFSAEAKTGSHVGIVGRTGAGKSTLLLSLLNLVPLSKGKILIDGTPITSISKPMLHQIIGVLPQAPFILKGWSVEKFIDPEHEFSREQLLEAVAAVGLAAVIAKLPFGLSTIIVHDEHDVGAPITHITVSTGGTEQAAKRQLSDSQLRLLTLARLSLHKHRYRLLLVDEPPSRQVLRAQQQDMAGEQGTTCDVDESEKEVEVADLLKSVFPSTTVFIVAHHSAALRNCDAVWVLSKGKLASTYNRDTLTSQEELTKAIFSNC